MLESRCPLTEYFSLLSRLFVALQYLRPRGAVLLGWVQVSTAPWQLRSLDYKFCSGSSRPPGQWCLGENDHRIVAALVVGPSEGPRSLEVECVACDQGYCNDKYAHGSYMPYVNNGSYFDVMLLRGEQVVRQAFACSNRVAYKQPELHCCRFTASHFLVASMQAGDRVELAAHSRYDGWTNTVWHASLRWVH